MKKPYYIKHRLNKISVPFSLLQPTKRYFLVMFFISCILLEIFTFVIYQQSRVNLQTNQSVIHSYEVLSQSRTTMGEAHRLTDNEQDYIQTNDPALLTVRAAILASMDSDMGRLIAEVGDNPAQMRRVMAMRDGFENLKQISNTHIDALLNKNVTVYSLKGFKETTQKAYLDARSVYNDFNQAEQKLLQEREEQATAGQKNYIWTLMMGEVLGIGALVVSNIVIFLLISRSARAETKLRKSEELLSLVLNGFNDGIYDINIAEGKADYSFYKKTLGYSDAEIAQWSNDFFALVHPDDVTEAKEILRQYAAREISEYCNIFRVRHKDGRWIWVMSRGVGIWNEEGKLQRLIGTHTDITMHKQREQELSYFMRENEKQSEELAVAKEKAEAASQAKSDFLATMSHEIRTPMNAVIGLSTLLLQTRLDEKQHEMTETLHANADILLRLVNDLLDLSRIEAGQIDLESRPFSFDSVFKGLHAVFDGQAAAKGLTFDISDEIGQKSFIGDPMRIQQILVNLVGNALKFTSRGGIAITAGCERIDAKQAQISISVADTGVGIPSHKIGSVFDKFVQADQTISRRFGGTGLGLAICQSLAQAMHGYISVNSTVGEGSTFTFRWPLPFAAAKKESTVVDHALETLATSFGEGRTILLVEDYAPNVMVASLMLEHIGYHVDVARCGADAIKKIADRDEPYAAVLMDVQMHDMNGFEATRCIRELEATKGFRHQIIGVTAHALAGDRERCLESGMDDYMSKPINVDVLAQKLGDLAVAA